MRNTFHHEINDRLWGVDDTVRVCYLNREALKKLLVDGIEKLLFLREVFTEECCLFNIVE